MARKSYSRGKRYKYKDVPKELFCGSAGGSSSRSYPVNTPERARAALAYARFARDPEGVRKCVRKIASKKGWLDEKGRIHMGNSIAKKRSGSRSTTRRKTPVKKSSVKKTSTRRKTVSKKSHTKRNSPVKKTSTRRKTVSKKSHTKRKSPVKKTVVKYQKKLYEVKTIGRTTSVKKL